MDNDSKFVYHEYEETHEGIIKSFIDRYPYFDIDMLKLFKKH